MQQQCQGNELIVSGENGRERASVPKKKFGLLTSLIYDIDCILPTFSFNFFHDVVLYWEADEFLFFRVEVLVSAGENPYQDR